MKLQSAHQRVVLLLTIGLAGLTGSCVSARRVTLAEMSSPARATVERVTAGGRVDQIHREVEKHSVVYDVEATVGGKHLEFLIADTDGTVLGTEVPIEFGELPAPVRVAVERHFGTTMNLTIMKGEEFGETQYEVEGPSRGRKVEVTFDSAGKRKE